MGAAWLFRLMNLQRKTRLICAPKITTKKKQMLQTPEHLLARIEYLNCT